MSGLVKKLDVGGDDGYWEKVFGDERLGWSDKFDDFELPKLLKGDMNWECDFEELLSSEDKARVFDKALARKELEWLQKLDTICWLEIYRNIGVDFIRNAIQASDYKDVILLALVVNQAAKHARVQSDHFYDLKDLMLQKAVDLALGQAPAESWGLKDDEMGNVVLYFDLWGYGQFSFHVRDGGMFESKVPEYLGDWCQRNVAKVRRMTFDRAMTVLKQGERALSIESLRKIYDSGGMTAERAHNLYVRAKGHADFEENRSEIEKMFEGLASTVPDFLPTGSAAATKTSTGKSAAA